MQLKKIGQIIVNEKGDAIAKIEINPLMDEGMRKEVETAIKKALLLYNDYEININRQS